MSELGRIADNEDERRKFILFWGDRYVESRSALGAMRQLLVARCRDLDVRIAAIKQEQALGVPREGTG